MTGVNSGNITHPIISSMVKTPFLPSTHSAAQTAPMAKALRLKERWVMTISSIGEVIAYADFVLTSDEFFRICNKKFDIVFVDGLHEGHQVYKDIQNSLKHLNQGGVIICHDINPAQFENGYDYEEYDGTGIWNGDCWKGFVKYRYTSDYECYVLPEDEADVGVIDTNVKSTINEKMYFNLGELTFNDLNNNRNEWLNIKTLEEVGIL